ncbi:exosortase-associated protein EpsI, V-type [Sandarakinorhabdus sp.]|uniref:exosortase-associated protein EpsI, V-type n=1 Tax=Sandarakinorhabdus sp. TaxID=1916663 RepID=UPI00286E38C3|nr:exosortase-associated protein EpsI, V-type [Sandarakinorhabdus sp.]
MSAFNRRDVLMGGSMLVAAGGAAALTPRGRLVLLPEGVELEKMVPTTIAEWVQMPTEAIVLPKTPGSLADRLYSQTLSRLYVSETRLPMMLVIAYGAVQNDLLQLHRPEVCYAAVGFNISASKSAQVALGNARLPVRELTARNDSRVEAITYWTRIGDDLPTDGSAQRWVKLRQQMQGYLADGVLVRVSTVAEPSPDVFRELDNFAAAMVKAIKPADRAALIGRPLAARLA